MDLHHYVKCVDNDNLDDQLWLDIIINRCHAVGMKRHAETRFIVSNMWIYLSCSAIELYRLR